METQFEHKEIARKLANTMAEKATEVELRRLYEETMFQQFISMDKSELLELLWHWIGQLNYQKLLTELLLFTGEMNSEVQATLALLNKTTLVVCIHIEQAKQADRKSVV